MPIWWSTTAPSLRTSSASAASFSPWTRRSTPSIPYTAWGIAGRHEAPALQPAGQARPAAVCPARAALRRHPVRERGRALPARGAGAVAARGGAGRGHRPARAPQLLASASGRDEEVDSILRGLQRTSSRVWVVDRSYQIIAQAGSLQRPVDVVTEAPWWQPMVSPLLGWLIPRPTEDFVEARPEDVLATGGDVAAAMQGTPATRTRHTRDGRAVVMSAAHPIWSGDEVTGAVVTEETTNSVMS